MPVTRAARAAARPVEPLEPRLLFAAADPVSAAEPVSDPTAVPSVDYHLTALPAGSVGAPTAAAYLDALEPAVRALAAFQDDRGRIIDPYAGREVQYSTPYFAFAVATLVGAGRAADLLSNGIAAMDSATGQLAAGRDALPDDHAEFYLAPLADALPLYARRVSVEQVGLWRQRMGFDRDTVLRGSDHNWRTYAMKGEWARAKQGLIGADEARSWIEQSWAETQTARFSGPLSLYHDRSTSPDTYAYDAAARGNLLAMLKNGYDGPSRARMEAAVVAGTDASLYLQGATGEAPAGGRSGAHVWNDVVNGLNYERMAGHYEENGDAAKAGQYRRAAGLALQSTERFRQPGGLYSVTKNAFDPQDRVGYATYSFLTNYNGYVVYHLAETYLARVENGDDVVEAAVPAEVGGYAVVTDPAFAGAFASAGGMQVQAALRGSTALRREQYWTTLGVTRFSRAGWDSRLGPGDAHRVADTGDGVSFAPTFLDPATGTWPRLGSLADEYEGAFSVQFTHPLLVRATIDYRPTAGRTGATFRDELVITPDGVLSTLTSSAAPGTFGMTWPVLSNDGGLALQATITSHVASTGFAAETDRQNYIALHAAPTVTNTASPIPGAYGDVMPVRAVSGESAVRTFVYPSSAGDPPAEEVRASYVPSADGFATALGRVSGTTYVGRTSAGGVGDAIDLDADGSPDVTFGRPTGFVLTLNPDRTIARVEADRDVTATIGGGVHALRAYRPQAVTAPDPNPTPNPTPDPGPGPIPEPGPTPEPVPPREQPGVVRREAEALTVAATSDRDAVLRKRVKQADGRGVALVRTNAPGDFVAFRLDGATPGTYRVTLRVQQQRSGGTFRASLATAAGAPGTDVGAPHATYSRKPRFADLDLGTITIAEASDGTYLRLRLDGKGPGGAGGFRLVLDSLTLTPA